jgi:hypothetical protein
VEGGGGLGSPMPGGVTGPSCSWGIVIRGGGGACRLDWGSLVLDSTLWSRVLGDSGPKVTALAKPRSNCMSKLQIHPLVR